eukprot:Rhum_TRINITY_DN12769_c1_g1::Rhum_TRINITY_DN12769_c1_g1_i1::g.54296::m.54296
MMFCDLFKANNRWRRGGGRKGSIVLLQYDGGGVGVSMILFLSSRSLRQASSFCNAPSPLLYALDRLRVVLRRTLRRVFTPQQLERQARLDLASPGERRHAHGRRIVGLQRLQHRVHAERRAVEGDRLLLRRRLQQQREAGQCEAHPELRRGRLAVGEDGGKREEPDEGGRAVGRQEDAASQHVTDDAEHAAAQLRLLLACEGRHQEAERVDLAVERHAALQVGAEVLRERQGKVLGVGGVRQVLSAVGEGKDVLQVVLVRALDAAVREVAELVDARPVDLALVVQEVLVLPRQRVVAEEPPRQQLRRREHHHKERVPLQGRDGVQQRLPHRVRHEELVVHLQPWVVHEGTEREDRRDGGGRAPQQAAQNSVGLGGHACAGGAAGSLLPLAQGLQGWQELALLLAVAAARGELARRLAADVEGDEDEAGDGGVAGRSPLSVERGGKHRVQGEEEGVVGGLRACNSVCVCGFASPSRLPPMKYRYCSFY